MHLPGRRAVVVYSILGLALLAGCTDSDGGADEAPTPPAVAPRPIGFELVCPPNGATTDGMCSYSITSFTESNQEPFVAVHPTDAKIIAIGVNAGHTTDGASQHGETPGFDMVRLDIFITTDAGETWTKSTLPYVPDPAVSLGPIETSVIGDPALEFDENGTLHVSGIASHSQARGYNVFYTQSRDLGVSWEPPTVLSTSDDNDRNWINIGPDGTIYVPWQRVGTLSEVAWSRDGGLTWNIQERSQVAQDCITVSEMAFLDGQAFFACARGNPYHVVVYSFDPDTGDIHVVADEAAAECVWPKLNRYKYGLFLSAEGCPGNLYATSADGRNWTEWAEISTLTGNEGAVMWQTDDPWGNLHFLQTGPTGKVYTAWDPKAMAVLATVVVGPPPGDSVPDGVPESIAPTYGDHYWGIDISPVSGAMVWTTNANHLDLTFLTPVFPPTQEMAATGT